MADVYERARPEYPAEAVDWIATKLDLRPGRTVLDLGAGTGKLTRALIPTGARVIAVEPGDAMRAELERAVPSAVALRGSAEAIPLGDNTVDAITVGQAFHWFRHDEAIPELHRVLRRGRSIALVWNSRDHDAPLHQEVGELIAPFVPADRPPAEQWPLALEESPLFGALEERQFPFSADPRCRRVGGANRLGQLRRGRAGRGPAATRCRATRRRRAARRIRRLFVRDEGLRQPRGVSATSSPPSSS